MNLLVQELVNCADFNLGSSLQSFADQFFQPLSLIVRMQLVK